MEAHPQLSVVVVNYNTRDLLLECITSVFESTPSIYVEVVVVDNASSDGSYEAVRKAFPQVTATANVTNRGFGAACNQAIPLTSAPFLLLLNSDARLTQPAIEALRQCLNRNPRCGAAGCRMIDGQERELTNTYNFLTAFNQALEMLGLTRRIKSRRLRRTRVPTPDCDLFDCSVDWIDASCLMLRRAALDEVGLFDEQFFMYSEDEDLCFRLRKAGWFICFSAAASAIHQGGASTTQNPSKMLVHFYSSQRRLLLKHRGRASVYVFGVIMKMVLAAKSRFYTSFPDGSRGQDYAERLYALKRAYSSGQQTRNAGSL
jgi:N-acetylglucosaminyl-diphospho-decaprenol L-rhamnosyltransferase